MTCPLVPAKVTGISKRGVAFSALVGHRTGMYELMPPHVAAVALDTLVVLYARVNSPMALEVGCHRECLVALLAFVRPLSAVCS